MDTQGDRLREERLRLGLSQEAFGAHGGVRKQAQIKYEKGERKPDAAYFEGIAAAGADVSYIVSGRRTPGPAALVSRMESLARSTAVVQQYLDLSPSKQELVRDVLFGVAIRDSNLLDQAIDNYVATRLEAESKS